MITFIYIINILFQGYTLLLFIRILSSWLPELARYRIVQWVYLFTDPYLNIFRRFIPPLGMIDISPIFAFLCLGMVQNLTVNILAGLV